MNEGQAFVRKENLTKDWREGEGYSRDDETIEEKITRSLKIILYEALYTRFAINTKLKLGIHLFV